MEAVLRYPGGAGVGRPRVPAGRRRLSQARGRRGPLRERHGHPGPDPLLRRSGWGHGGAHGLHDRHVQSLREQLQRHQPPKAAICSVLWVVQAALEADARAAPGVQG